MRPQKSNPSLQPANPHPPDSGSKLEPTSRGQTVGETQKNHPNPAQPCANSSKRCIKWASRPLKKSVRLRDKGGGRDFLRMDAAHFEVLAWGWVIVLWLFMSPDALRPSGR